MLRLLIAAVVVCLCAGAQATSVGFVASGSDFRNPERGFWREANGDFLKATASDLDYAAGAGTVIYAPVRLDAYRGRDLPKSVLDALATQFALVRAKGLKLILRFAYNDGFSGSVGLDASVAQVLRHIAQVKPVVAANKDVVFVWEMGFIGPWGEGHSSSSGLSAPANKKKIGDALLAALPADRKLMWRTPDDLKLWYPQAAASPRIGMFNDCFLADTTDVGTFSDDAARRSAEKGYLAAMTKQAPFGGETCYYDKTTVGERTGCADILAEGARFHMSFLGRDWYGPFIDGWRAGGCLDDVSRSLGYRLQLTKATASESVLRGSDAAVSVTLRNVGWAAPVNPRRLVLRIRSADGTLVKTLAGRDLATLGASATRTESWTWPVPVTLPKGSYFLSAAAPDASPSLAGRPVYAIRFANGAQTIAGSGLKQGWNASLGEFALGLQVKVK
ncbi:DUF4832 domain-containing protein [Oryzibacter oryziterrae]|uniref:DUF4832 domain-containing protein n=1 Tax=Oryzibacter oryziterrae TaxID=2766474 RepID=UPI001F2A1EB6|nr:DUF4832 domain-containing protein [Oryzibacter oryziterrae]